jgi:hypothetical protein
VLPIVVMADRGGNNGKKEDKKEQKIEKKIKKEEKKAEKKVAKLQKQSSSNGFLHRAFPWGWFKNNVESLDDINLDDDFRFKRFLRATTSDITAPSVSNIVSRTGIRRALVTWNTNENTSHKLFYSTTSPVNLDNSPFVLGNSNGLMGRDHYALINGLATSTTYYAVIESKDKAGNVGRSSQFSFLTKSGTTTISVDTMSPSISSIFSIVGTSTIDVSWNTNENATSKVYYSTSTPIVASTSPFILSGSFVTNRSLKIQGLATGTLYYLMIESTDSSLNTATSSTFSTTTLSI